MKKLFNWVWGFISPMLSKKFVVDFIEKQLLKILMSKLAIVGGLKLWLLKFVLGKVMSEADDHIIEPALRRINLISDTSDGKKRYGRKENAETVNDWRDTVRDS